MTWNLSNFDKFQPLLPSELLTYQRLSIDVSGMNWPPPSSSAAHRGAHRAAFATFVQRFYNMTSLVISGNLPLFDIADFDGALFCTHLTMYTGSILFMGALHHLCNLEFITLTDFDLLDSDIFTHFPTTFFWSTSRLQTYMWDEDALKHVLECSHSLSNLTMDVGDEDVEWVHCIFTQFHLY